MNETRMQQAMEGVTSIAQRVLEAVPIQEPWSKAQIVAELKRTGSSAGVDVVHGCLNNLRGKGLITEPESGKFIRTQVRKKQSAAEQPQDVKEPMTALVPQSKPEALTEAVKTKIRGRLAVRGGPMDALANIADSLALVTEQMAALAKDAYELATEMQDAVLEAEIDREKAVADLEKLRQLQALLKGIGS